LEKRGGVVSEVVSGYDFFCFFILWSGKEEEEEKEEM